MAQFDARAARALLAGQHLTVDEAPGLRLVASASRRTWVYRFKSPTDGRMRQVRLGQWPAMSVAAAVVAWEGVRQARLAGADPALERRQARQAAAQQAAGAKVTRCRQAFTVRRLADEYLARYQGTVAPRTHAELERLLARELDAVADLPAAEVTRSQAFDLIDAMRGLLPSSLIWSRMRSRSRGAVDAAGLTGGGVKRAALRCARSGATRTCTMGCRIKPLGSRVKTCWASCCGPALRMAAPSRLGGCSAARGSAPGRKSSSSRATSGSRAGPGQRRTLRTLAGLRP